MASINVTLIYNKIACGNMKIIIKQLLITMNADSEI